MNIYLETVQCQISTHLGKTDIKQTDKHILVGDSVANKTIWLNRKGLVSSDSVLQRMLREGIWLGDT